MKKVRREGIYDKRLVIEIRSGVDSRVGIDIWHFSLKCTHTQIHIYMFIYATFDIYITRFDIRHTFHDT